MLEMGVCLDLVLEVCFASTSEQKGMNSRLILIKDMFNVTMSCEVCFCSKRWHHKEVVDVQPLPSLSQLDTVDKPM